MEVIKVINNNNQSTNILTKSITIGKLEKIQAMKDYRLSGCKNLKKSHTNLQYLKTLNMFKTTTVKTTKEHEILTSVKFVLAWEDEKNALERKCVILDNRKSCKFRIVHECLYKWISL